MYTMSAAVQKVLKAVHLISVCCWLGGGTALFLLSAAKYQGWITGQAVYGADLAAHVIDRWVVVNLGAFLCFMTGLAYGVLTKWGFFRHRWIVLKWVVLFLCIGFGIWLGGKEQAMLALSHTLGEEAMAAPEYRAVLLPYCLGGLMQICVLVAVVFISIFKPFGRRT